MDIKSKDNRNNTSTKKKPRFILNLTDAEKKEFLNSFDYVFCDCDGVIWDIEKAGDGINQLKKFGKRFVYVSNNSVRDDENYLRCFKASGVVTDLNDVIHPLKTIIEYLKEINFNELIYCIGTSLFKNKLKEAGFKIIDGPNKILEETYVDLARNVFDKQPVKAVIIDVDFNLSASKIIRADLYLKHPDCIFIAGASDMKLPVERDITIIGPGPYVKILKDASGKKPTVLGKPGKDLGDFLTQRYNIKNRKRVLMIGDMLEQDIAFGKNYGFQTLLVLSGGCSKEQLDSHSNSYDIPDYYANSMADFIEFFKNYKE